MRFKSVPFDVNTTVTAVLVIELEGTTGNLNDWPCAKHRVLFPRLQQQSSWSTLRVLVREAGELKLLTTKM